MRISPVFAVALIACQTTTNTPPISEEPPTDQDVEEVAKATATILDRQLSPENGIAKTTAQLTGGEVPAWLAQARAAEGGLYLGNLLGLRYEIGIDCVDATGVAIACGPGADASDAVFTIGGQLSLFGWTGSFEVSLNSKLTGLTSAQYTIDHSAEIELGSQFVEWFRPVTHQTAFSISATHTAKIDRISAMPVTGQGRFAIEYTREASDVGQTGHWLFEIESSLAAGIVTFSVNGVGYRLDLATGRVEKL